MSLRNFVNLSVSKAGSSTDTSWMFSLLGGQLCWVFLAEGRFSSFRAQTLEYVRSVVAALGLSRPAAGGIFVPWLGIEPVSPALEGRFLTTGPPGKSLDVLLHLHAFVPVVLLT